MSVLARVLGKFLSDQEHDFLVGWLVNKCCLHAFKQNGYMKNGLVLKNKKKKFIWCSWAIRWTFLGNFVSILKVVDWAIRCLCKLIDNC